MRDPKPLLLDWDHLKGFRFCETKAINRSRFFYWEGMMAKRLLGFFVALLFIAVAVYAGDAWKDKDFKTWDQKDVQKILNDSPGRGRFRLGCPVGGKARVDIPRLPGGEQVIRTLVPLILDPAAPEEVVVAEVVPGVVGGMISVEVAGAP